MPVLPDAALLVAGPHDQAHNAAGDRTVSGQSSAYDPKAKCEVEQPIEFSPPTPFSRRAPICYVRSEWPCLEFAVCGGRSIGREATGWLDRSPRR
jgi:hypothetical protein